MLAEIALRTSRIQVASGVLPVWGRTPATLAMTAELRRRDAAPRSASRSGGGITPPMS